MSLVPENGFRKLQLYLNLAQVATGERRLKLVRCPMPPRLPVRPLWVSPDHGAAQVAALADVMVLTAPVSTFKRETNRTLQINEDHQCRAVLNL